MARYEIDPKTMEENSFITAEFSLDGTYSFDELTIPMSKVWAIDVPSARGDRIKHTELLSVSQDGATRIQLLSGNVLWTKGDRNWYSNQEEWLPNAQHQWTPNGSWSNWDGSAVRRYGNQQPNLVQMFKDFCEKYDKDPSIHPPAALMVNTSLSKQVLEYMERKRK